MFAIQNSLLTFVFWINIVFLYRLFRTFESLFSRANLLFEYIKLRTLSYMFV